MNKSTSAGLGLLLLLAVSAPAVAEWRGSDKNWRITPILWTVDMEGTTTIGDRTVPIDLSFSDILDETDFALSFALSYVNRDRSRFGFLGDVTYMKLSPTSAVGELTINQDIDLVMGELGVTYDLGSTRSPLQILLGARFYDFDLTFSGLPLGATRSDSAGFTDVLLGVNYLPQVGEKWWLQIIGGYSGGDSNGVPGFYFGALWQFKRTLALVFGYRYLGLDFEDGFGPTRIAMDVDLQSPLIGLEIAF